MFKNIKSVKDDIQIKSIDEIIVEIKPRFMQATWGRTSEVRKFYAEEDLKELFSECGEIESVKIILDQWMGHLRFSRKSRFPIHVLLLRICVQ